MKKKLTKIVCVIMACTIAGGMLTSCGNKRAESDTITVLNMGAVPEIDMNADYYPILDELTAQWGKKFRLEFISWGEEMSTLQTRIAGGNYDATSIGPWSNYVSLAQSNAFYDLNKVLDSVPALVESYGGRDELKRLEINGKLNYIPQYTTKSPDGATYRKDLAEKWGIEVTDYDSLKKYLYKAKEEFGRPMMYSSNVAGWIVQNFIALTGSDASAGLAELAVSSTHDDPFKAVLVYELPEYKKALEEAKEWYDNGLTDPDVLNTTVDVGVMLQDGLLPVHLANHIDSAKANFVPQAVLKLNGGEEGDPNAENPNGISFGFMPYYPKDTKMFDQNMGNTTGFAINATVSDETAEAIIKLVEAAHTDKEFFDKYQYGKQGVSYDSFPTDTTVSYGSLPGEVRMYRKFSTALTDSRLARSEKMRYSDTEQEWDEIRAEIDAMLEPNPLNGFVFDSTNVENEILAVTEVINSTTAVRCGILGDKTVDEALSELITKLKDAGIEKIIDELNSQLAAFKDKYGE